MSTSTTATITLILVSFCIVVLSGIGCGNVISKLSYAQTTIANPPTFPSVTPATTTLSVTTTSTPIIRDSSLKTELVVSGLNSPTSMAFLGPNDFLILEKNTGKVKEVKNGKALSVLALDAKVATSSERGMLGIDVTKTASGSTYAFLYYTQATSDGGTPIKNGLFRYTVVRDPTVGGAARLVSPITLLTLPVTPGPNHDGGTVRVGPEANVYTVLGDLNRQTKAQNFENGPNPDGTSGILRVTQSGGTVGTGILGTTDPLNKYFAYGVRNSFGIDFDPVNGRLWDTENGPDVNDEINLFFPGYNSGWKDVQGIASPNFNFNNLVTFGGKGTYSDPEFVWTHPVAPTAIKFLTSTKLGSRYLNDMFVGDYNNGRIYHFDLNSERTALLLGGALSDRVANADSENLPILFGYGFGGVTDLKVGPGDGYLYVVSIGNGAVYRILPKQTTATTNMMVMPTETPPAATTMANNTFPLPPVPVPSNESSPSQPLTQEIPQRQQQQPSQQQELSQQQVPYLDVQQQLQRQQEQLQLQQRPQLQVQPQLISPIANATSSQIVVNEGTLATLDGRTSYSPNRGAFIAAYQWTQVGGIPVMLSGVNTATPTFVAPHASQDTTLAFNLMVTDNNGITSAKPYTVYVTIKHLNNNAINKPNALPQLQENQQAQQILPPQQPPATRQQPLQPGFPSIPGYILAPPHIP